MSLSNRDIEQQKALAKIREGLQESKSALCVCATGYGKGHLIKLISSSLKKDSTLLVIVPRVNLVRDLSQRTGGSVYCATLGEKNISRITIATKQSIKEIKADFIILDEAHNYKEEFIQSVQDKCKFLLGFTATPFRSDGFIYGEGKFWPDPCYEFGIKESIDAGFLCGYEMLGSPHSYKIKKSKVKRDFTQTEVNEIIDSQGDKLVKIVSELLDIIDKKNLKKCAILCASISHAEDVVELLKLKNADYDLVHSKLKDSNDLIEQWKHSDCKIMVSVMMLTEGFDCPEIDCVAFLRPTKSTRVMIQAVGRGLRLSEGKDVCTLLDYGSVFDNCGTPINPMHVFESKSESDDEVIKTCEVCHYIWEKKTTICPACGHEHKDEKDYNENLKESVFSNSNKEKEYLFTRDDIKKTGTTIKKSKYLVLERNGIKVTLFGKQVSWLYGIFKSSTVARVFYVEKGMYKNATKLGFATDTPLEIQDIKHKKSVESHVRYFTDIPN